MLWNPLVFKVAIVNVVGGMVFGYAIGFIPLYLTFHNISTNCTILTSKAACASIQHSDCVWMLMDAPHNSSWRCEFADTVAGHFDCQFLNTSLCREQSGCYFDARAGECKHNVGWNSARTGIFASSMTVGGMIGSFGMPPLLRVVGRKYSIALMGVVGVIGSCLTGVGQITGTFWLLTFSRVIVGAAGGMACVVCPLYVDEMAPSEHRGPLSVLFQVFVTSGIFLAAALGYAIAPTDFSTALHMDIRCQLLIGVQTLLGILCVVVGVVVSESTKWKPNAANDSQDSEEMGGLSSANQESEINNSTFAKQMFVAVALCAAQQMTGINAIMNYAPQITRAAGFTPLLGNFLVMLWNCLTSIIAVPAAKRFTLRQMYVSATAIAAIFCVVAGVGALPYLLVSNTVRHVLSAIGILVFILVFEIGMGPAFFPLAQELFPRHQRSKGSSLTMVIQFTFNIIVSLCFPIAVEVFSGGGNEDQGLAVMFFIFGLTGAIAWVILYCWLHPVQLPELLDRARKHEEEEGDVPDGALRPIIED